MYRLLIVDDEPIIADGLYAHFTDQNLADLEIYRAYSAPQALEILRLRRMDIVISDIQMPGMTGLALAEYIHKAWPRCQVIFLTGHDNFDYLYQAQKLGSVQYLLKNEGYPNIVKAFNKALSTLHQQERDQQLIDRVQKQEQLLLPLLRRELLLDLLEGETPPLLQEKLDSLGIRMDARSPVLLLTAVNCARNDAVHMKEQEIRVNMAIQEQLGDGFTLVSATTRLHFVWLLQPLYHDAAEEEGSVPFVQRVRGLTESVHQICLNTFSLPLSFVLAHQPISIGQIAYTFERHQMILQSCMLPGMDGVVLDGDAKEPAEPMGEKSQQGVQQLLGRMELALQRNEFDESRALMDELEQALSACTQGEAVYATAFHRTLAALLHYGHASPALLPLASALSLSTPMAVAFSAFREMLAAFLQVHQDEADTRSGQAVLAVKQYIQDHPESDLSLSALADLVYFNPKYLSRLFKQSTGLNLSDYILDIRLTHARELLENSSKKVHEIGAAIGYWSAPAFTRLFKSALGMTPQEYRDSTRVLPSDGGQMERK